MGESWEAFRETLLGFIGFFVGVFGIVALALGLIEIVSRQLTWIGG